MIVVVIAFDVAVLFCVVVTDAVLKVPLRSSTPEPSAVSFVVAAAAAAEAASVLRSRAPMSAGTFGHRLRNGPPAPSTSDRSPLSAQRLGRRRGGTRRGQVFGGTGEMLLLTASEDGMKVQPRVTASCQCSIRARIWLPSPSACLGVNPGCSVVLFQASPGNCALSATSHPLLRHQCAHGRTVLREPLARRLNFRPVHHLPISSPLKCGLAGMIAPISSEEKEFLCFVSVK